MRHGKRWTISEILSLQREFELLGLTVTQMADKHKRSESSIMFKLHAEGLIPSIEQPAVTKMKMTPVKKEMMTPVKKEMMDADEDAESDTDSSSDYNDEDSEYVCNFDDKMSDVSEEVDNVSNSEVFDKLSDRVWNLESSVSQIGVMVKQLLDNMATKKTTKKLAPLRKV